MRKLETYAAEHKEHLHQLLLELARIPAPTVKEERRAQFCLEWLHSHGAKDAYIDQAGNVVWLYEPPRRSGNVYLDQAGNMEQLHQSSYRNESEEAKNERPLVVFDAHMDVVFPDETELPLVEKEGRIYCPGVGDDTANLAVLLMMAAYAAEFGSDTGAYDVLFVCGVGEEGLGNLKGVREICREFGERIAAFYAFDLTMASYTCRAVGSLRYRVEVMTSGGHSYQDFGNTSANAVLAELICMLYGQQVPKRGKTTYNVGTISGGTSVNTIAQQAELLYEVRSDDAQDLKEMEQRFGAILEELGRKYGVVSEKLSQKYKTESKEQSRKYETELKEQSQKNDAKLETAEQKCDAEEIQISTVQIGARPCEQDVDAIKRTWLFRQIERTVEQVSGKIPTPVPCSTDCNIPLSMGIPSVCIGTCCGAGAHTREEYVEADSLVQGLQIGLQLLENVRQLYQY